MRSDDRFYKRLNPIRQVVMGKTVSGHFGVKATDSGLIQSVTISFQDGPSLVIEERAGYLDVSLKA